MPPNVHLALQRMELLAGASMEALQRQYKQDCDLAAGAQVRGVVVHAFA